MGAAVRFLIASGCPIATTTRYRCLHLQEQLRELGYESEVVEWFAQSAINPGAADDYDAFFLYRLAMSPPLRQLINRAQQLKKPLIFDADDLIFEPDLIEWHRAVRRLSAADQQLHGEGVRRYRETLLACDAATMATPLLAEFAGKAARAAYVHRNALGSEMMATAEQLYRQRQSRAPNESFVIGYGSGTPTHEIDFEEVAQALRRILNRYRHVKLWIVGPLTLSENFPAERVVRFPLTDWRGWFELLSQMDVALAPLELGNIFCRAKSEIKFVEAAALGVPVVASDIDPFRDSMSKEHDGFLAANEKEWEYALSLLIEQPERRSQMGENARRTVLQHYSAPTRAKDLSTILPLLMNPTAKK